MKSSVSISLSFLSFCLFAQIQLPNEPALWITYESYNNGKLQDNENQVLVISSKENSLLTTVDEFTNQPNFPVELKQINVKNKQISRAFFSNSRDAFYSIDTMYFAGQKYEFLPETKTILEHTCKLAKTVINSNTIEIWYDENSLYKGSPRTLGADLGLVLEIVINGNFTIRAKKIEEKKLKFPSYIEKANYVLLDELSLNDKIWKSKFTTIPIFDHQILNWSENFTPVEGVMRFANGTIAVKKIKFPKLSSQDKIFIDVVEQSNGDAYDRTGSIFFIPTQNEESFLDGLQNGKDFLPVFDNGNGKKYQGVIKTKNYEPLVELIRFFTPFGIKQYNDRLTLKGKVWQDSVLYRQEISDYAELMNDKEVYIGAYIGNYDQGGHLISTHITIHKEETTLPIKKVIPLFNTLNVMEMAGQEYGTMFSSEKGLYVEFELTEKLKHAKLRYTTTGHGGWENGDEFVPKKNTILFDGQTVFDLIPWREDCGSYRLYNPISGNFSNGLSSSDYSRSNWCPGTLTQPYIIDLGDLEAGVHKIQVKIPMGEPEGSSYSLWNVSGVLIGE